MTLPDSLLRFSRNHKKFIPEGDAGLRSGSLLMTVDAFTGLELMILGAFAVITTVLIVIALGKSNTVSFILVRFNVRFT